MPNTLRVAVIGAGAFGRNHLRVLREIQNTHTHNHKYSKLETEPNPSAHLAAVVDPNPIVLAEACARYSIPGFATVAHLLAADLALHAATVCTPTVAHAEVAEQLLSAGLDVLIEKPLTSTLAEAAHLSTLGSRLGRILAVGHLERFNPAVTAAIPRLTRPMFFEAHRLSIFTPRSLDVDVVLDLMIHDLDILLTMARSPVSEVRAVGLPVLSPKVDIANVRLEFASGAIANLTASRVSTEQVRKLRLFQPAQYLSLDYARQELLTINVDPSLASPPSTVPGGLPASNTHPSAGLSFDKLELPRVEPLRLELEDFLHSVARRTSPRVTAEAARNALALALEINSAISAHTARVRLR